MTENLTVFHYFSPIVGWMEVTASESAIHRISYLRTTPSKPRRAATAVINRLIPQLDAYFSGRAVEFDVPLDTTAGSEFQRTVWEALMRIPYGETRSYAQLAADAGRARAFRAVGSANGCNRIPILIPCHRVIKADGTIGGYTSGSDIKQKLLELEGIRVDESAPR